MTSYFINVNAAQVSSIENRGQAEQAVQINIPHFDMLKGVLTKLTFNQDEISFGDDDIQNIHIVVAGEGVQDNEETTAIIIKAFQDSGKFNTKAEYDVSYPFNVLLDGEASALLEGGKGGSSTNQDDDDALLGADTPAAVDSMKKESIIMTILLTATAAATGTLGLPHLAGLPDENKTWVEPVGHTVPVITSWFVLAVLAFMGFKGSKFANNVLDSRWLPTLVIIATSCGLLASPGKVPAPSEQANMFTFLLLELVAYVSGISLVAGLHHCANKDMEGKTLSDNAGVLPNIMAIIYGMVFVSLEVELSVDNGAGNGTNHSGNLTVIGDNQNEIASWLEAIDKQWAGPQIMLFVLPFLQALNHSAVGLKTNKAMDFVAMPAMLSLALWAVHHKEQPDLQLLCYISPIMLSVGFHLLSANKGKTGGYELLDQTELHGQNLATGGESTAVEEGVVHGSGTGGESDGLGHIPAHQAVGP